MKRLMLSLFVSTLPLGAAAQTVSLTPIVGAYVPLKVQASGAEGDVCDPPCPATAWTTKLASGPAFGIKAAVTWDASVGLEASFMYGATSRQREATSTEAGEPPEPGSAQTTVTAVRMTVTRPVFERAAVTLGAGFALNSLSGSGYESNDLLEDQSRLGLTVSGAFRLTIAPSARVELGFASSFYSVDQAPDAGLPATSNYPQHDMILSLGVTWGLGK